MPYTKLNCSKGFETDRRTLQAASPGQCVQRHQRAVRFVDLGLVPVASSQVAVASAPTQSEIHEHGCTLSVPSESAQTTARKNDEYILRRLSEGVAGIEG